MNQYTIYGTLLLGVLAVTFLWANPLSRSNDQFAGAFVDANKRVAMGEIDHNKWNQLLQKYVDSDGRVDYAAWQSNAADRKQLKTYLAHLSQVDHSQTAPQNVKLAYWINAYNAVTVEGILRVYPTTSIRNHTPRLVGYNIWKNLLLYSGDKKISLNDIEHEVLRNMDEPRIHFAIVCASIGCPRLLNEAYVAEKLDNQLTENAKDFFSREQNLVVDSDKQLLKLSSLISWFDQDFGDSQSARLKYLKPYMPAPAQSLINQGKVKIEYLDYDWNLNKQ